MFLNQGEETQKRSLKDPWELTGDLLFDSQVLLDTIMMKGGTLAPLYTDAATFYSMNNSWWNRHKLTFQKWWEVIDDEYKPLWDRDGFEETIDRLLMMVALLVIQLLLKLWMMTHVNIILLMK